MRDDHDRALADYNQALRLSPTSPKYLLVVAQHIPSEVNWLVQLANAVLLEKLSLP